MFKAAEQESLKRAETSIDNSTTVNAFKQQSIIVDKQQNSTHVQVVEATTLVVLVNFVTQSVIVVERVATYKRSVDQPQQL